MLPFFLLELNPLIESLIIVIISSITDYNILNSKSISYANMLLREKLNFKNGYDVIKISSKYILEELLNVDCSDIRNIISNACKIKPMIDIINKSIILINVKETARLYHIPKKFITHVDSIIDNSEDINYMNHLFEQITGLNNVFY